MKNQILLYAVTLLFSGCAFVELSDQGALVKQGTEEDIVNCELVAEVSSQTKDKILIDRSDTSVRGELAVLARNKAAENIAGNHASQLAIALHQRSQSTKSHCSCNRGWDVAIG